ncbi:MAG: glycoside hydrolase family 43 protein [bacterium]|nr:glycoside hydrolase family 43 protein [bacterium]MDI1335974.1 glycoside hydrolase family 43 protein [Lacunisphaera sp.]
MKNLFVATGIVCGLVLLAAAPAGARVVEPGTIWRDTNGQIINAHGGGMLFHEGIYYWYGEFKEGLTYLPKVNKAWGGTRVIAGGVSCYSSTDLVTWKNEGLALPSNAQDPDHDLAAENVIERPKVIYNVRTKKFVMWFHQDSPNYAAARSGVAVSDTPAGPFKYLGSFRPNAGARPLNATEEDLKPSPRNLLARDLEGGQMARDMTVFVDDDGTAYQFYASESNQTMHVSQLSDDYLRPAGKYARIHIGKAWEAPAIFKHNGKYYMIGSGTTGWDPNPGRSAVADSIFGPWRELGNPCQGPGAELTFGCQSNYVLPVAGRPGRFIAMFDRWNKWNLQDSLYVWLPVEFDAEGKLLVSWQYRWTLPE